MVNKELRLLTYFGEGNEDPHDLYAQRRGISRQDAKVEFYQYMSTQPLWRDMCQHHMRLKRLTNLLMQEEVN